MRILPYHRAAAAALAITGITATTAIAQTSQQDLRATIALRATHIASLTPMMSPAMIGRQLNGAQLGVRYGLLEEGGVRTQAVAGSGIFLVGMQSSLSITAGVNDADCVDCSPAMMLGAGADMRVMESSNVLGASSLSVAVSGDFGYAQLKPGSDYALALGVGAPITLSFGGTGRQGMHFVPYFTPMFGVGETSTPCFLIDCQRSGTRFVLGGGVGVWNPMSNLSASVGINQVMISGAQPVFGVNVVLGGK